MSDQDNGQVSTLQRPISDDPEAWKTYWKAQGWPWRTEPEIDAERQKYLAERRAIVPNIEQDIYPFRNIKLNRADVEWLLATHENGRGPVDWSDEDQHGRKGLDLRGADLRSMNLDGLPLASIRGGLDVTEWRDATLRQRAIAGVHLEDTSLWEAHLEGSHLRMAHLEEAYLREVYLTESDLMRAHLKGIYLRHAHMEWADLRLSSLEGAFLYESNLKNAILRGAHLGDHSKTGANCLLGMKVPPRFPS